MSKGETNVNELPNVLLNFFRKYIRVEKWEERKAPAKYRKQLEEETGKAYFLCFFESSSYLNFLSRRMRD